MAELPPLDEEALQMIDEGLRIHLMEPKIESLDQNLPEIQKEGAKMQSTEGTLANEPGRRRHRWKIQPTRHTKIHFKIVTTLTALLYCLYLWCCMFSPGVEIIELAVVGVEIVGFTLFSYSAINLMRLDWIENGKGKSLIPVSEQGLLPCMVCITTGWLYGDPMEFILYHPVESRIIFCFLLETFMSFFMMVRIYAVGNLPDWWKFMLCGAMALVAVLIALSLKAMERIAVKEGQQLVQEAATQVLEESSPILAECQQKLPFELIPSETMEERIPPPVAEQNEFSKRKSQFGPKYRPHPYVSKRTEQKSTYITSDASTQTKISNELRMAEHSINPDINNATKSNESQARKLAKMFTTSREEETNSIAKRGKTKIPKPTTQRKESDILSTISKMSVTLSQMEKLNQTARSIIADVPKPVPATTANMWLPAQEMNKDASTQPDTFDQKTTLNFVPTPLFKVPENRDSNFGPQGSDFRGSNTLEKQRPESQKRARSRFSELFKEMSRKREVKGKSAYSSSSSKETIGTPSSTISDSSDTEVFPMKENTPERELNSTSNASSSPFESALVRIKCYEIGKEKGFIRGFESGTRAAYNRAAILESSVLPETISQAYFAGKAAGKEESRGQSGIVANIIRRLERDIADLKRENEDLIREKKVTLEEKRKRRSISIRDYKIRPQVTYPSTTSKSLARPQLLRLTFTPSSQKPAQSPGKSSQSSSTTSFPQSSFVPKDGNRVEGETYPTTASHFRYFAPVNPRVDGKNNNGSTTSEPSFWNVVNDTHSLGFHSTFPPQPRNVQRTTTTTLEPVASSLTREYIPFVTEQESELNNQARLHTCWVKGEESILTASSSSSGSDGGVRCSVLVHNDLMESLTREERDVQIAEKIEIGVGGGEEGQDDDCEEEKEENEDGYDAGDEGDGEEGVTEDEEKEKNQEDPDKWEDIHEELERERQRREDEEDGEWSEIDSIVSYFSA